uniref:WxL protein peptidoglycan domain-containing protein n=1 Tax=Companilactobacillus farciminis TaxID=1612 RepID=UPI0019150AE0
MKNRKIGLSIVIAFFVTLFLGFSIENHSVDAATSGNYALKVGGENNDNVNIDNGSYMVTGDPGQTVDLKLLVVNKSDSSRKFLYNVNTAYTTDGGNLAYDKTKVSDPSLKIQTRNLVTPKETVFTIPGGKTATLTVKLTIPKEKFNGYLMGGFNVVPYKEKAKGTVSSNGTLIKNKFSYSIPIQVHQSGAESEEAKYSVMTVKPSTVVNGPKKNPAVLAKVHNSTNSYTGQLDAKAVVTQKGNKKFKIVDNKSN